MRKLIPLLVIFLPLAIGWAWLLVMLLTRRPVDARELATVTGTMATAEEHALRGRRTVWNLEIHLRGDRVAYVVSDDGTGYRQRLDRKFFAEVAQGDTLELTVAASEIAKPSKSPFDPTPRVFVLGVRAGDRDYLPIEGLNAGRRYRSGKG